MVRLFWVRAQVMLSGDLPYGSDEYRIASGQSPRARKISIGHFRCLVEELHMEPELHHALLSDVH